MSPHFAAIVCAVLLRASVTVGDSAQERLAKELFQNYDKSLLPISDHNTLITVKLNPAIHSIINTDMSAHSITFVQWLRMSWTDEKLRWDPQTYDGIKQLMIPISRIWYPDIIIDNMIAIQHLIPEEKNYAIIDFNGSVKTSYDDRISMYCKYKMSYFPFDVQNCSIHFASWMFTADLIDLLPAASTDMDFYQGSAEWRLISLKSRRITVMHGLAQTPYVDVHYDIVIQRKPLHYLLNFVFPCFVIVTLGIVSVFSPISDSGESREKLFTPLIVLLLIVALMLVADQKQPSLDSNSLLGVFFIIEIVITTISSLAAVLIMFENSQGSVGQPVPFWMLYITHLGKKISSTEQRPSLCAPKPSHMKRNTLSDCLDLEERPASTQQELIQTEMQAILEFLRQLSGKYEKEKSLKKLWVKATHRIDLFFMFSFTVLHVLATLIFLIVGFSKLENFSL